MYAAADNDQSSEAEASPTDAEDSKEDTDAADSNEADDNKSEEKPDDEQSSENDDNDDGDDEPAIKKREVGENREVTTKSYPVDDLLLVRTSTY